MDRPGHADQGEARAPRAAVPPRRTDPRRRTSGQQRQPARVPERARQASDRHGLLWNDPLSTLMRSSTPVAPERRAPSAISPRVGPPKRRTIEGRFDDESRCYSVIITVSRDSARMTVIRRESGPSWSRELGAAAPSGSHCHVARSPDRASDHSPSRRPLLRPLHVPVSSWPEACFRPYKLFPPWWASGHPEGRSEAKEPRLRGLTRRPPRWFRRPRLRIPLARRRSACAECRTAPRFMLSPGARPPTEIRPARGPPPP